MYDVITIGTATRDVFLKSVDFKILRDKEHLEKIGFATGEAECFALGAKIEVAKPVITGGGGAANTAISFARQGLKTVCMFKIGNDDSGNAIIQDLKKEGVMIFAEKDKKLGTAYSTILLTKAGERTILVYRGASEKLSKEFFSSQTIKTKWAYIVPGNISFEIIKFFINKLKTQGVKIAFNPSKHIVAMGLQELKLFLAKIDVVILNREEGAGLTGLDYDHTEGIFKKLDDVVQGIIVMTNGSKGAWVSDGKTLYKAGIFKECKLIDRTGAGDAFGSGFIAGLIQKNDIPHALRLASANATSVVEHIGAQNGILTKKEFNQKRWQNLALNIEPI